MNNQNDIGSIKDKEHQIKLAATRIFGVAVAKTLRIHQTPSSPIFHVDGTAQEPHIVCSVYLYKNEFVVFQSSGHDIYNMDGKYIATINNFRK